MKIDLAKLKKYCDNTLCGDCAFQREGSFGKDRCQFGGIPAYWDLRGFNAMVKKAGVE